MTKAEVTPEQFYGEAEFRAASRRVGLCLKHGGYKAGESCPHCAEDEKILAEKARFVGTTVEAMIYASSGAKMVQAREDFLAALLDFAREVRR